MKPRPTGQQLSRNKYKTPSEMKPELIEMRDRIETLIEQMETINSSNTDNTNTHANLIAKDNVNCRNTCFFLFLLENLYF